MNQNLQQKRIPVVLTGSSFSKFPLQLHQTTNVVTSEDESGGTGGEMPGQGHCGWVVRDEWGAEDGNQGNLSSHLKDEVKFEPADRDPPHNQLGLFQSAQFAVPRPLN